ncbi:MAG: GNAT family N-acetyltransferase [Gammaproteobacteria bacterium]
MTSFAQIRIDTDRLLLRPLCEADAAALFAIHSDPKVMRYWSTPPWSSIEKARARIAEDIEAVSSGKYLHLGIERKDDAQLIGTCNLFNFSVQCRRAEIGYGLASSAWGRGYMHEALLALLDYGFSELSLNRIEADIDPENEASARSLLRLGFRKEGHLRERWIVDGVMSDSDLYGLLLSDWQSGGNRALQVET